MSSYNYVKNAILISLGDDTVFFQLGMSMSLLIAVVIMAILVVFMLSVYIYHKRGISLVTMS